MSKHLEIIQPRDASYIQIHVKENVVISLVEELMTVMKKFMKETDIRSFLLDVRDVRSEISPIENYEVAYKGVKESYQEVNLESLNKQVRVALLASPGDNTHTFAETVGKNAGNNISLFYDHDEAVAWLLDNN